MNHGSVTTSQLALALRYLAAVARSVRWVPTGGGHNEWRLQEIASDGHKPTLEPCGRVMYRLFPDAKDHAAPVHHWERLRVGDNPIAQRYEQLRWAISVGDPQALWEIDKILALLEPSDPPGTPLHLRDHQAPKRRDGLRALLGALSTWKITSLMLSKN